MAVIQIHAVPTRTEHYANLYEANYWLKYDADEEARQSAEDFEREKAAKVEKYWQQYEARKAGLQAHQRDCKRT